MRKFELLQSRGIWIGYKYVYTGTNPGWRWIDGTPVSHKNNTQKAVLLNFFVEVRDQLMTLFLKILCNFFKNKELL